MNIQSLILLVLILAAVVFVLRKLFRDKKAGRSSCSCGGGCSGCSMRGECHKK